MTQRAPRKSALSQDQSVVKKASSLRAKTISPSDDEAFKNWVVESSVEFGNAEPTPAIDSATVGAIAEVRSVPLIEHLTAKSESSTKICSGGEAPLLSAAEWPHPNENSKSTEILITAGRSAPCSFGDREGHIQISGDIPALFASKLQEIGIQLKDLISEILMIQKSSIGLTDFICSMLDDSDGYAVWFLKVNTLPGFTSTSLYPDSAKAAGIAMPELVKLLALQAWTRRRKST